MTYKVEFSTNNEPVAIGDTEFITITVSWDGNSAAVTSSNVLSVSVGATDTGKVAPVGKSTSFPATIPPQPIKPVDTSATYNLIVKGLTAGKVTFKASIDTKPDATLSAQDGTLTVLPANILYTTSPTFSNRVMKVATDDTLTPTTATSAQKSTLTFKAAAEADSAPVADIASEFTLRNLNADANQRGGKYFGPDGKEITFNTSTGSMGEIKGSVQTGSDGTAALTIVSNKIPAFISCSPTSGSDFTTDRRLYIYDESSSKDLSNFVMGITPDNNGVYNITDNEMKTFTVDINAVVNKNEYAALILNDKLQDEKYYSQFINNKATFNANTSDLIYGTDKLNQNIMFYTISSAATLTNSKRLRFTANGNNNNNGPLPTKPMVGPISNLLDGGAINYFNVTEGKIDIIIPLKKDRDIITSKGIPDITTTNSIKVYFNIHGDSKSNVFHTANLVYDVTITSLTDTEITYSIYANDYANFGLPKDPTKTNNYSIWYAYKNSITDDTTIAESHYISGDINTVKS